ncbi:hypothetical protein BDZ89DRAFT_1024791 [Hymenopellis radicata]|nr:hypothetical protein BDZ89DRAFT_1024791 [Hymenopellis radicata]
MTELRVSNRTLVAVNEALRKRVKRFSERLEKATTTAVEKVVHQSSKEKRIITPEMRLCVLDLARHGVPMDHIAAVILAVADAVGIQLEDAPCPRSCRRIVKEGGVLSNLHTMDLINHAESLTISGDGTSYKNLNYEVKHVTLTDYLADPTLPEADRKRTMLVALENTASHTSEAQLASWEGLVHGMHTIYNESPLGLENPQDTRTFYTKACGMLSDHAPDQTKTCRLFMEKRDKVDLELRGEAVLKKLGGPELVQFVAELTQESIQLAGGITAWEALSNEEQTRRSEKVETAMILRVGKEAFDKLPPEEQKDSRRFVWGGCAMHKEVNAAKGAFAALAITWPENDHVGPIVLFNKDNAAAAKGSDPSLKARAEKLSGRGGVKLVELMGMLLNNSNKKLGQQDMHSIYFEEREHLGRLVRFPDISNNRYGSHGYGAAEVLTHLPVYIEFMQFIKAHKGSGLFTNLEQNIFDALHDLPTRSELGAMTIYSQCLGIPYMVIVRGEIQNQLDLPPIHAKVKAFCKKVIDNPRIPLDEGYETASLNGKQYLRPDAMYAVIGLSPTLPLVEECIKATFKGALETWERFTEDERSAQREGLTKDQKMKHFLRSANDHSEGGAGTTKRAKQRAPNASMEFIDSKSRWTRNSPKEWVKMKEKETPGLMKYAMDSVRVSDANGDSKRKRQEIAGQAKEIANTHTQKRVKTKARRDEKQKELDACIPIADPARLKVFRNADLDLQIDWHRAQEKELTGAFETPSHSSLGNRAKKTAALMAAVTRRHELVKSGKLLEFYTPPEETDDEQDPGGDEMELEMDQEDDTEIVGYGG